MKSMLLLAAATTALALGAAQDLAYAQSDGGSSLADSMQVVADAVTAQGPVTFTGSVTDSSDNSSWTYSRTVTITNFKPDVAACTLSFHFSEVTPGNPSNEVDGWVPFVQVHDTKVESLEDETVGIDAKTGHPTWRISIQPVIYVVSAERGDGTVNDFDFYSQDTATRVATAIRRATQLCGGS